MGKHCIFINPVRIYIKSVQCILELYLFYRYKTAQTIMKIHLLKLYTVCEPEGNHIGGEIYRRKNISYMSPGRLGGLIRKKRKQYTNLHIHIDVACVIFGGCR